MTGKNACPTPGLLLNSRYPPQQDARRPLGLKLRFDPQRRRLDGLERHPVKRVELRAELSGCLDGFPCSVRLAVKESPICRRGAVTTLAGVVPPVDFDLVYPSQLIELVLRPLLRPHVVPPR